MSKNKKWSGFFTNLLGVILGITLTFGANSLWQKRDENKKIKEMLTLIRKELETNKEWFKGHEKKIRSDCYVYKKIIEAKGNFADIPKDTLKMYRSKIASFSDYQLTTSSWQIFQNSEMIQKMTDKELVIRLTDCYWLINKLQEIIMKEYWDSKKKTYVYELDTYQFFEALMNNKETVFFYSIMGGVNGYTTDLWDLFPIAEAYIDYAIMILDKHGDYRYDMDEKDKEMESFIDARIDSLRQKNDSIRNR